jgi:hypothetical protein
MRGPQPRSLPADPAPRSSPPDLPLDGRFVRGVPSRGRSKRGRASQPRGVSTLCLEGRAAPENEQDSFVSRGSAMREKGALNEAGRRGRVDPIGRTVTRPACRE